MCFLIQCLQSRPGVVKNGVIRLIHSYSLVNYQHKLQAQVLVFHQTLGIAPQPEPLKSVFNSLQPAIPNSSIIEITIKIIFSI